MKSFIYVFIVYNSSEVMKTTLTARILNFNLFLTCPEFQKRQNLVEQPPSTKVTDEQFLSKGRLHP